jgi:glyoxylase-like metal-dependent hydrolase (beta-lactamase superfamily II)
MTLRAVIVPVTPFQQNCSIIWCDETREGAVIDPGGDLDAVMKEVGRHGITVRRILLTHAHLDHCAATVDLAERLGVPVEGPHRDDLFWIESLPDAARSYGFPPARSFEPARWLSQGDEVAVGNLRLEVRHCPGHTPGHVVFFEPGSRIAFVGDVLFQGSIGRTDFPRGDYPALIRSIRENLFPLGDDVRFVPGHGPMSTFGDERRTNPFVSDRAVGARR